MLTLEREVLKTSIFNKLPKIPGLQPEISHDLAWTQLHITHNAQQQSNQ
jgi:hypothetical protein